MSEPSGAGCQSPHLPSRVVLLIDNYDSFTWNLVHRLGEVDPSLHIGRDLVVVRNDAITAEAAETIDAGNPPARIIISPGPCTPKEAGCSAAIISRFAGRIPLLGVCLGHQTIADMEGMLVSRHALPIHGKASPIHHDGKGLFTGLPNPFVAARYHSLVVDPQTIPPICSGHDGWQVSAWTNERDEHTGDERRVVMGLRRIWADRHKAPVEGVQFHPESFLTPEGPKLLANFLAM